MVKNYLSIDIGGTQMKYAVIDQSGNFVLKNSRATPQELPDFLAALDELIVQYQADCSGVAVSCPGKVDSSEGTIYFGGSLPFLHELNLVRHIEESFNLPAAVVNDGKAAALSELWRGNLKGIVNGAAIILGTGVGGGLIIDGKLYQGYHFQAGELSFQAIPDDSFQIASVYGFRGSAVAMIKACAEKLELEDVTDGHQVFGFLNQEDERVYPIFQQYCRSIALLIYNMQSIIDVERYVIGGGISAQKIVVQEIKEQYQLLYHSNDMIQFMVTPPDIQPCAFRNEANLLGALYQLLLTVKEDV